MTQIKKDTRLVKGKFGIENLVIVPFTSKIIFRFLNGINRNTTRKHILKLKNSIEQKGCLRPVVIAWLNFVAVPGWYVIDGQHLLKALEMLEKDIPVVQIQIDNMEDLIRTIAKLNLSSKSWTLINYIEAWYNEKPNYREIIKYRNEYKLEIGIVASILMNKIPTGKGGLTITKVIKLGEFEIVNVEKAKRVLETLSKVLTLFTPKTKINKRIVVAEIARFLMVNEDYNETALLQFVMENKVILINESNNSEQIASLLQQGLYESFDLK